MDFAAPTKDAAPATLDRDALFGAILEHAQAKRMSSDDLGQLRAFLDRKGGPQLRALPEADIAAMAIASNIAAMAELGLKPQQGHRPRDPSPGANCGENYAEARSNMFAIDSWSRMPQVMAMVRRPSPQCAIPTVACWRLPLSLSRFHSFPIPFVFLFPFPLFPFFLFFFFFLFLSLFPFPLFLYPFSLSFFRFPFSFSRFLCSPSLGIRRIARIPCPACSCLH